MKLIPLLLLATASLGAQDTTRTDTTTRVVTPVLVVERPAPTTQSTLPSLVPLPAVVRERPGEGFIADSTATMLVVDRGAGPEIVRLARAVARMINRDTVRAIRRQPADSALAPNSIRLRLDTTIAMAGPEAYALVVTTDSVSVRARTAEGLFRGIQTLRQLFPVVIEHPAALGRRLRAPGVEVEDAPRYSWRGSMLDVSRHFLPLDAVKRHIDAMALYKLNRLHLHLSDDQGWRIEIRSYPSLTRIGGSTQVGGGPGGYYTQAQFRDLVRYARDRYIVIVPEIDMPGHTNAALASVAALNCNGKRPPLYTGIKVGFSTVCTGREAVYTWVDNVVREIAAISPGPWFHVGGDEVEKLSSAQYRAFIDRVERIVRRRGKVMVGWNEVAPAPIDSTSIVQHWRGGTRDSTVLHARRGGKVILSPGSRLYIDMKYDSSTVLGLRWAGIVNVQQAYDWDPATYLPEVGEQSILGVEAPLWSETLVKPADFQYLAFPRLLAVAELGWTPQERRSWDGFRDRLGAQGGRMQAIGLNFHRATGIDWR